MKTSKIKFPALMKTFHFATFVCLFTLGLLSGCAPTVVQDAPAAESSDASEYPTRAPKAASEDQSVSQKAQHIPERPLDEQTMSLLLQAEFALHRNDLETALGIYEQLALQTSDPGIARRSTEIAMAANDPFRSLDAALLYLELAPEDAQALQLAVRALARSAEIEGGWALLDEQDGKTYELRMMTAEAVRLASQMKDNYQIEWLLEQVTGKYSARPEDKDVQLALAMLHEALGNFEAAVYYATLANQQDSEDLLSLRLRANSLLRTGQTDEASELLSAWIQTHSEDPEAQISLAQLLMSFDPAAALPIMEKLSDRYPWSGQLLMSTAQLHLTSDNQEAAIPYYQKLTQFGSFRNLSLFNLGRIHEQANELELAASYYAAVGSEENADVEDNIVFEAALRQARIEHKIGDNGRLLFEKLRQLYPEQAAALIHEESRILINENKYEQAIDVLSTGIESHPENEALLYTRSISYERLDDIDAAIADLTTILSFDEANSVALNALGYTLANRTDRYEEAYDLIDRALAIDPEDPAIIDSMGWVLYRLGRYEEALEYLQRAHDALLDEEVISHLAEVLWKLDRSEEAKQVLDQGEIDLPDSELIPETRTRLGFES